MSRFNNPKALPGLLARPEANPASVPVGPRARMIWGAPPRTPLSAELAAPPLAVPNALQSACFVVLCVFVLSSYANEFAFRLLHGKAYLSTIAVVLLPLLFLCTGKALRGFEAPTGKWWLAFGGWLTLCAPFSVYKSDTLSLLANYYPRSYLLYFVVCACALNIRQLRTLVYVLGFGNFLVVLSCFAYGYNENGRFSVPNSVFSFLSNSNELALQLLLGIAVLIFAFFKKSKLWMLASLGVIAMSLLYMLKTGSRGAFVSILAMMAVVFLMSKRKIVAALVMVSSLALAMLLLPAETRHRLSYIAIGDSIEVSNQNDASSLGSQRQRTELFWQSVRLTFQHPLFGVGPGEFTVADTKAREAKGEWAMWRQTHNSYTQVSSEAGLPGFLFYVASIVACLLMNIRVYRVTARRPGLEDYAGVSFCMLLSTVVYAVGTVFDHLAYTSYLPLIAGISAATYLAARPLMTART
jgi:O-antigen ligase